MHVGDNYFKDAYRVRSVHIFGVRFFFLVKKNIANFRIEFAIFKSFTAGVRV